MPVLLILIADGLVLLVRDPGPIRSLLRVGSVLCRCRCLMIPSGTVFDDPIVVHLVLGLVLGVNSCFVSGNRRLVGRLSTSICGSVVVIGLCVLGHRGRDIRISSGLSSRYSVGVVGRCSGLGCSGAVKSLRLSHVVGLSLFESGHIIVGETLAI